VQRPSVSIIVSFSLLLFFSSHPVSASNEVASPAFFVFLCLVYQKDGSCKLEVDLQGKYGFALRRIGRKEFTVAAFEAPHRASSAVGLPPLCF
jgi:hypothetical protein